MRGPHSGSLPALVPAEQVDPRSTGELFDTIMDVATLVARLLPLLCDPIANGTPILELLGRSRGLADYEVARFLLAKRSEAIVHELLASPDAKVRRSAVRWVELTFA